MHFPEFLFFAKIPSSYASSYTQIYEGVYRGVAGTGAVLNEEVVVCEPGLQEFVPAHMQTQRKSFSVRNQKKIW
jgi:hypothetical protein